MKSVNAAASSCMERDTKVPSEDRGALEREWKKAVEHRAEELFGCIVAFLQASGLSEREIATAARQVVERVEDGGFRAPDEVVASDRLTRLCEAYARWWREPEYLDSGGGPLPLALQDGKVSITSLLREFFAPEEISAAAAMMRRSPSVSVDASGRWHAKDPVLVVANDPDLSAQKLVALVRALLSTFSRNQLASNASEGLLERTVVSAQVPANYLPVVQKAVRKHLGQTMLSLHQLITNAEQRPGERSGRELGVEVFMYELPEAEATSNAAGNPERDHPA